ncbi:MAG TPA: DsbC family protein [Gammaproteobacteria bacterium]|jgi:thiol:disulfide interchange protein DsbC|nr:DsbC family protein [Gammaproteobacteria bacterium]
MKEILIKTVITCILLFSNVLLSQDGIDIKDSEASQTNEFEEYKKQVIASLFGALDEQQMVIFSPERFQHTVTVFTDIDCGFCRKFHNEIDQVMEQGIRIRYLFFPRTGPFSESWEKAEQVWCSQDQHSAMTKAKKGQNLTVRVCPNTPVEKHFNIGQLLQVQGTPTIISDKGEIIVGYLPAEALKARLESNL